MPFGVRVEHTHRLYGAAVGLSTIVLAAWFLAADRRRSMRWLGMLALLAVMIAFATRAFGVYQRSV